MTALKSPTGFKTKTLAYEGFMGIDSSRDATAMDTGKQQHLVALDNGFCDWRGQIVRDPALMKRVQGEPVTHVRFFSPDSVCWAERRGSGIGLFSDIGISRLNVFSASASLTSTVFNRVVHFFARDEVPYIFDGTNFVQTPSDSLVQLRPSFGVAVSRRMAVAGVVGSPTKVLISRVDDYGYFPDDEAADSENVLRAGFIDIGNLLGTSDVITGLSDFEQNRLVIFSSDRAFVYKLDPSIEEWQIEDRANIQIGCISHNTIARAGSEILFCSRHGVHSLTRSRENGITVFSRPMSTKIELIYRKLVKSVENIEDISAVFDNDNSHYHVFFPQPGGAQVRRLTMALVPDEQTGDLIPKWSTATLFNLRCGDYLAGNLVFGTNGGVYDALEIEETGEVEPTLEVLTPVLWCGSLTEIKESHALLIQASGNAVLTIEAMDETGKNIGGMRIEVSDKDDDDSFPDIPLVRQYEQKFERRFKGLQLRIKASGSGLFRMSGIAVVLRTG